MSAAVHQGTAPVPQGIAGARAKLDQRVAEYSENTRRVSENQNALAALEELIEQGEAAIAKATLAKVMGDSAADAPTSSRISDYRSEAEARRTAARELERRQQISKEKVDEAKQAVRAAAREHIRSQLRPKALKRMERAQSDVRDAAVDLMAIDRLESTVFADPTRDSFHRSAEDMYGPAAFLLESLKTEVAWKEWPYSLRPDWLPKHGPWRSFQIAGVAETQAQIRADLGLEDFR
jgi:hypothetical protein